MADSKIKVECGFCLRKNEALNEPKTLPCTHVHCLECLAAYFDINHWIVCPLQECGEVFETNPDALPSHEHIGGVGQKGCDVCAKKDTDTKQSAVVYCTVCYMTFCSKHQQHHDEVLGDHRKISMDEYQVQASKLQARSCPNHEDQPYALGCRNCLILACLRCIPELDKCDNDEAHHLMRLDDLVTALVDEGICNELMAKEDQYEKLFKVVSKARAEYDNKTAKLVEDIHQSRDRQLDELKRRYDWLESNVVQKRQNSREQMTKFMEEIVLKKWTQLRNQRQMTESRVKHSDHADVVIGYKELKEKMLNSVEEKLPQLTLRYQQDFRREYCPELFLELTAIDSEDVIIDGQGMTTSHPIPVSITETSAVKLPASPTSVCRYGKLTYVAMKGLVAQLNDNHQLYKTFISAPEHSFESVAVYSCFYTLSCHEYEKQVNSYRTDGRHIQSWTHPNNNCAGSMLTTSNFGQLVIADPTEQRLTVYSSDGKTLSHILCPGLSSNHIAMCAADNTSVIISDYGTSKVQRVNTSTGKVMWTLDSVKLPEGLARYGSYILLAAYNIAKIYIVDANIGTVVSEIENSDLAGGHIYDLAVYDSTLVVPHNKSKKIIFYKMNME